MIFANRKYVSGSGFAFWRWTDIALAGELYLRRLHVIQVPRVGAVMLHWILRPDTQRDLHDHPVSFLSLVLRGSYSELVPYPGREALQLQYVRWWNFKRATDAHCITDVFGLKGVVTLVFAGPRVRDWGFYTAKGWIPWRDYAAAGEQQ